MDRTVMEQPSSDVIARPRRVRRVSTLDRLRRTCGIDRDVIETAKRFQRDLADATNTTPLVSAYPTKARPAVPVPPEASRNLIENIFVGKVDGAERVQRIHARLTDEQSRIVQWIVWFDFSCAKVREQLGVRNTVALVKIKAALQALATAYGIETPGEERHRWRQEAPKCAVCEVPQAPPLAPTLHSGGIRAAVFASRPTAPVSNIQQKGDPGMSGDQIPLTHLARELRDFTGTTAPPYPRLYVAIISGLLPAQQLYGRWFIERSDLPAIAEALGLIHHRGATVTAASDHSSM